MAFLDYALSQIIEPDNLLVKVESIVDWEPISALLDKKLGKRRGQLIAGMVPYEYLSMFKALLIQQWHTLSDPKMEEALKTRIDFMWFTGFGLASKEFVVPDETTICRFRNKVGKARILEKLLKQVNSQLERHHLKVKITKGAVLDATLIEASVNSNAKPNVIAEDRNENNDDADNNSGSGKQPQLTELTANDQSDVEIDKDAKWLKKGKKSIFGYKEFIVTDATDGYIEHAEVMPANVSEVSNMQAALANAGIENTEVLYADKGYTSTENSQWLHDNGIGDGIMDKAYRNRPLTYKQKQRNKRISGTRYIVERTNATIKNIFKFTRTRYVGLNKVRTQALLIAVAHNLLKAANKIQVEIRFYKKVLSEKSLGGLFA
jgi:IS5 family transposase